MSPSPYSPAGLTPRISQVCASSPTARRRSRLPRSDSTALTPSAPRISCSSWLHAWTRFDEPLGAPLGVDAARELGLLRREAPRAAAGVTALAEVAAERHERRRADGDDVGAERDRLGHVGRGADRAGRDDRCLVADALVAQALVDDGDRDLDRDADVVADDRRRRTGAAPEAVEVDVVGTGAHDAARDGGDVVHGGDLDADRLVAGRLLERVDELAQVLDRVDVVVRRRARSRRSPAGSCASSRPRG